MKRSEEGAGAGTAAEGESLERVLRAFAAPLSEQQAWALLHQAALRGAACVAAERDACRAPRNVAHVRLLPDGTVHPHTFCPKDRDGDVGDSEGEIVMGLALVVFQALDFGETEREERLISPDLESLIADMANETGLAECGSSVASGDLEPENEDDEGIERDGDEPESEVQEGDTSIRRKHLSHSTPHFTLHNVIQRCQGVYGGSGATAAVHFQAVCRALLAEAAELVSFLERVKADRDARRPSPDQDRRSTSYQLDTLNFADWARFWMQVIGELRMGVKLKKVEYSRTPIEYELTPYEILMDDIRSRRYKLRPLSEEDKIPPMMKKTMHDLILDFIRSRPPLKKASERAAREGVSGRRSGVISPRDSLLAAIRRGTPLRPAKTRLRTLHAATRTTTTHTNNSRPHTLQCAVEEPQNAPRQPVRRLIKVDFDKLQDEEDDEEDDASKLNQTRNGCEPQSIAAESDNGRTPPRPAPRSKPTAEHTPKPWKRTAYDLATQCESRRASMRRHASSTGVSVLHSTPRGAPGSTPHSRPPSRQSHPDTDHSDASLSWSRSSLQDDLGKSQDKVSADDRVSLTLEEVVHIRSVLTESELENLPVENNIKEEVIKKKICFLCLKTRFTLFGPWGHRCKLCKKTVCQKCHSKMRIPMEHFSTVPVVLLSPSLLPSPEEETNTSFPRSLMARLVTSQRMERTVNCVGSTPSSPVPQRNGSMVRSLEGTLDTSDTFQSMRSTPASRGESPGLQTLARNDSMTKSYEGPHSLPFLTPTRGDRKVRNSAVERLRGTPISICNDCRDFVLKVIRASQIARADSRHRALQQLTLDLTPVYDPLSR